MDPTKRKREQSRIRMKKRREMKKVLKDLSTSSSLTESPGSSVDNIKGKQSVFIIF